ncbi:MAG: hypothetical protein ACE1Y4_06220, partial [Lysobacterales bacterium]
AVSGAVGKPISAMGRGASGFVGRQLGASPQAISKFQQTVGKGMGREAASFGLLSGGIEASMADPGNRMGAFARGFGTGALGGAAFRGVSNVAGAGLKRGLGAKRFGAVSQAAKPGFTGAMPGMQGASMAQRAGARAKSIGAKTLVGGVPLAAGLGASFGTPTFSAGQIHGAVPQGMQQQMGRQMGYPGGYNPNLPLPY